MEIPEILKKRADELEKYYRIHCQALAPLAAQCFLNTMETTVRRLADGTYFVITGDIPAMWLRDSAAQVRPYVKYAKEDDRLQEILESIIAKQADFVCIDPYANAFNECANGMGHKDDTVLNDHVWERKYEVDSLCAPLYLGYLYWKTTGIDRIFTKRYCEMIRVILHLFTTEQDHGKSSYFFQRDNCPDTDTLPNRGRGNAVRVTGMTWSGFRPSDDRCDYGYLIPSNMMAAKAMCFAAEIAREYYKSKELAAKCEALAKEIQEGIREYGITEHPEFGRIYAYETDGFGNYNLMDDANSPSLLSMPCLGYCGREDPLYSNTRRFVLSDANPFYFKGNKAQGMGSPHTPEGYVWHIGIIMQALTSGSRQEILECLYMLAGTHAGTNYMHESFDPSAPEKYSRPWFAWANSLFAELLDKLMDENFWEG